MVTHTHTIISALYRQRHGDPGNFQVSQGYIKTKHTGTGREEGRTGRQFIRKQGSR